MLAVIMHAFGLGGDRRSDYNPNTLKIVRIHVLLKPEAVIAI